MKINPNENIVTRLVKSEDLNHHGTLFAGRTAEWFVEAGFIAAADILDPENLVCLKLHGLKFNKPILPGDLITFKSKVVFTGKSSIFVYVEARGKKSKDSSIDGFMIFIHVNENTNPIPHNLEVDPITDEDKELYKKASELKKN